MNATMSQKTGLKTIAHFAPKGCTIGVAACKEGDEIRIRLYSISHGEFRRFDQLLSDGDAETLNTRLVEGVAACPPVTSYGFTHTDGTKSSGLRFIPDRGINTICLIVYALAGIVHGDRGAWKYVIL